MSIRTLDDELGEGIRDRTTYRRGVINNNIRIIFGLAKKQQTNNIFKCLQRIIKICINFRDKLLM